VVDYYPKFGFEEFTEFQYSKTIIKTKGAFRKLDSAEFVDLGGENMGFGIGVYVKNSAKAVELYQQVFGLELGYHVKNPDGSFYHSELCRNGECFLSVVETTKDNADGSIVQLGYEFNCQEEVKRAYDLLKEGGRIDMPIGKLPWSSCAASIVDRFGVCWYLFSDSHRPPEDYDYWKEVH
jgi:PhnB protein